MGVRIIRGSESPDSRHEMAVLYCSTTEWAFGPVFHEDEGHDADERAEAFVAWLDAHYHVDPRRYTDAELEAKYGEWRAQEAAQWAAKEADE